jgi:UDP-N-acetylmuramoylalanine--D-glutamate ligase
VLVHGLGRFGGGREATRFLLRRGCRVRVADKSDSSELQAIRETLDSGQLDWQLGREDLGLLDDIDLVVTSPAVPDHNELLAEVHARGIPRTQECEMFLAAYPGRVIGITGTNGKSSTTSLLHRGLVASGLDSLIGGNIGHSLLADEADWRASQVAVLEISSFQLERFAEHRRVHGAIFTRVGSDHIDRHGSLQRYQAAKGRLATAATDFIIHAADDPVANSFNSQARLRGYYASDAPGPCSAGIEDGFVTVRTDQEHGQPILHREALQLLGDFQLENIMAASLAASWLGASAHPLGLALATAAPLPFRLQLLAQIQGIQIFDNAVSTEVESTRQALATLSNKNMRLHWIGGGKSKDGNYERVAKVVSEYASTAHVFGAARDPFSERCTITNTRHENLRDALQAAMDCALPGDAILFSPAFASFDQYPNFRARALEFHSLLRERRAIAAPSG